MIVLSGANSIADFKRRQLLRSELFYGMLLKSIQEDITNASFKFHTFIFLLVKFAVMIAIITQFTTTPIPPETLSEILLTFAAALSTLGISVLGCIFLENVKEDTSKTYTTMPLPEELAPESVKQAIKEISPKNHWSHTLFNTAEQERTQPVPKADKSWHSIGIFGQNVKNSDKFEVP